MTEYEFIRFTRVADHVVQVVLDRPEVANALSIQLFAELNHAVGKIEHDDDIRVWLLTGSPRSDGRPWFSAGADLSQPPRAEHGDSVSIDPAAVINRIDDLLKPSIAVIGGMCTTGALELAMACDLRIASATASLSDWHLKATGLGIGQWGGAVRLARLVGVDKAKELLLTGVEITGEEAAKIGLVNRSVPGDQLEATALEIAGTIAAMPPKGVRTTLGFLAMADNLSKHEAQRWAELTPEFMGLRLRPFKDAAARFEGRDRPDRA